MNRPEDIQARLDNIRQIESIVGTLRALATAHQVEAQTHLEAIRAHEATIAGALSVALAGDGQANPQMQVAPRLSIVVGAAQGFTGAFADRMAEAARAEAAQGARLMVVGNRTASALDGLVWSADMAPHALEVPALASRLADALFDQIAASPGLSVQVLFADPVPGQPIVCRRIFPFDFSRFPPAMVTPLITLPPAALLSALVTEYVYAELCEALMLGFAAENTARAEAMARAQSNVKRIAADLRTEFQEARKEQMTTEIIEVSAAGGL